MVRKLSPVDISNIPDLVRLVETLKNRKQELILLMQGKVVAKLVKEVDPSIARTKLEAMCLNKDICTEVPPKETWKFIEPGAGDPYALVPVTLSYQGRSMVEKYYLFVPEHLPTPAKMLENSFDEIYWLEEHPDEDDWPYGKENNKDWKKIELELRRVLGADYQAFKEAGRPSRCY